MANKEKMLEWAEVLESGKYKQKVGGWGSLEEGELCCLNVALVHFTGKDAAEIPGNSDDVLDVITESFSEDRDWCGQFVFMNDVQKFTFPQIAQEIRKMVA